MTKDEKKKNLKEELVTELMNGMRMNSSFGKNLQSLGVYLECTGDMEIVKTWAHMDNFKETALDTIRDYLRNRFALERLVGMHLQMTGSSQMLTRYFEIENPKD